MPELAATGSLCLLLGVAACHAVPAETRLPDAYALDTVLEDTLGYSVLVMGDVAFPRPSTAAIAFKSLASLECRSRAPVQSCTGMRRRELLGVGVFSFSRRGSRLRLTDYRYLGETRPLWQSEFVDERPGEVIPSAPMQWDVDDYNDVVTEDIDGDGKPEFILWSSGSPLMVNESGRIVNVAGRTRLTILREDLSIQLDADIAQRVYIPSANEPLDALLRTFEELLVDDPRVIKVRWREFEPGTSDDLDEDFGCNDPTHEIVLAYVAESDRYRVANSTRLKPGQYRSGCEEEEEEW